MGDRTIEGMLEELASNYQVADTIQIDFCGCCGVNVRLYDEKGKLFAKFICKTGEQAREIAADLIRDSRQFERPSTAENVRKLEQRLTASAGKRGKA